MSKSNRRTTTVDTHTPVPATTPPAAALFMHSQPSRQHLMRALVLGGGVLVTLAYIALSFFLMQVPFIGGTADNPTPIRATIVVGILTIFYAFIARYYLVEHIEKRWVAEHGDNAAPHITARRLDDRTIGYILLATIAAWAMGQILAHASYTFIGSAGFDNVGETMSGANPWAVLCLAIFIAPASEEMLMRGVVYPLLRTRYSAYIACLATACIFGLLHANIVQFIITVPLSILTAWVYEMTRNLKYCIMLHMVFNTTAIFIPVAWLAKLPQMQLATIIVVAVPALGVAALTAAQHANAAYRRHAVHTQQAA